MEQGEIERFWDEDVLQARTHTFDWPNRGVSELGFCAQTRDYKDRENLRDL